MAKTILITGPARSGKSEWAEHLAHQSNHTVIYVATSQVNPNDQEWQTRLAKHRARRPSHWCVIEEPTELANILMNATSNQCLLIDSLGTWLANLIELDETRWQQRQTQLVDAISTAICEVIVVAEETGWGVVPAYPIGRIFRDRLGELVRRIGTLSISVYLVTSGYALDLKQVGIAIPQKFAHP